MNAARLFVGNLSYSTLESDLTDLFSQAGVVRVTDVIFDKFTGKSRGFAFIEMGSPDEANRAVEMFHNKEFQGRNLTVNVARPKEDRPPREGGGGGGGGGGYNRGGERQERSGGRWERGGDRGERRSYGDGR
jgi:RNA recognition motif-containing protein